MTVQKAIEIFLTAWRSTWDPSLEVMTWPRYPYRELGPSQNPDGSVSLSVSKRGFGYKRKKSIRPREPPAADVRSIQEVLNLALPAGFRIREVQDQGKKILIVMEEINHEKF
jgi:hypothetical protein